MISTNDFQVKVELHFPAYTRISTYPGFTKLDLDTVENSLQTFKEEFSSFFCTKCNFLYDYRNNKVSLKIKSKLSEEEIDNFCKYTICCPEKNVEVSLYRSKESIYFIRKKTHVSLKAQIKYYEHNEYNTTSESVSFLGRTALREAYLLYAPIFNKAFKEIFNTSIYCYFVKPDKKDLNTLLQENRLLRVKTIDDCNITKEDVAKVCDFINSTNPSIELDEFGLCINLKFTVL